MTISDLYALCLAAAGACSLWWLAGKAARGTDAVWLRNIVAGTAALRTSWSYIQHHVLGQYYDGLFGQDTLAHYGYAAQTAQAWREGIWHPTFPTNFTDSHRMLIDLKTTLLIYIFGPSIMLSEVVILTGNVSICIAVYLICRHLRATSRATLAAVALTAFLPSLVFWSTQDLRDPVLATCAAWATLGMLRAAQPGARAWWLTVLAVSDTVALFYRPYMGILLVSGQGLAWAYTVPLPRTNLGSVLRATLFLLMAPVAMYFGVKEMKDTYGDQMGLQWAVDQYSTFREAGVAGGISGSEYEIPINASTPAVAILQLPIRILLLLLTPIPLFPGPLRRMMMFPEMWFLYLWVVPRFWRGIREAWNKNRGGLVVILLMLAPVVTAYALKTSVSGEAVRMRIQFLPELLIFAGIGHVVLMRERAANITAYRQKLRWLEAKRSPEQDTQDSGEERRRDEAVN